jgi:glycosyltransferase involved in cell wall biosynthesis
VKGFRAALPGSVVYVYDNNSTDRTVEVARTAGAVVRRETHQGKGYVVRRMFADVDADVYVLVDGDATYDAPSAREMVARLVQEQLDMVLAARVDREEAAYRPGHRFGNRLLSGFVTHIFGEAFTDMLSGYRVFSRRFVKSFPVLSGGFEIETELTIHALELGLPAEEVRTPYYARPEGSASKLNTYRDGLRILLAIMKIYRAERPLRLFLSIGAGLALISIGLAIPIFITFIEQGTVPRFPTAILSTGLMLAALLSVACGLVLDTVTQGRREAKLLAYLRHAAPGDPARD